VRAQQPTFAGLREQLELLTRREASSRELVERSLARIEASQETLNAFRCTRPEAALAEADEADRRLGASEKAPLLGVPVAIKDDTDLAGESTPFGCAGQFEVKGEDAEVVRRLKAAGAVIVGKTTTPEIGQWPLTESPTFGVTRNPWSLQHTPGGSSGGSAAAVAAGLVPAALGSDGLGSVRIPAAWTNLVGIKPQRGRISPWPEPEPFNGLACIGPLGRTVADVALLLDAVSGHHPRDPHRPPRPAEPFAAAAERADPGRPLHIALSLKSPYAPVARPLDKGVQAAIERVGEALARLGHLVELADPAYGVLGVGVLPRSIAGVSDWVKRVPDRALLDSRTVQTARLGARLGGRLLRGARSLERPMARQLSRIFRRFDLVLTPTTAKPPLPVGAIDGLSGWVTDKTMLAACPYTWPWNVVGWPAINVPAGLTEQGLPLGAQLLGPANSEPLLIALAGQLERSERWHERHPEVPFTAPASAAEERAA
jgi:amidase